MDHRTILLLFSLVFNYGFSQSLTLNKTIIEQLTLDSTTVSLNVSAYEKTETDTDNSFDYSVELTFHEIKWTIISFFVDVLDSANVKIYMDENVYYEFAGARYYLSDIPLNSAKIVERTFPRLGLEYRGKSSEVLKYPDLIFDRTFNNFPVYFIHFGERVEDSEIKSFEELKDQKMKAIIRMGCDVNCNENPLYQGKIPNNIECIQQRDIEFYLDNGAIIEDKTENHHWPLIIDPTPD